MVKDRFKHMAEFCRSKLTGGIDDQRWRKFAEHYDALADRISGRWATATPQKQQQQQQQQQQQPQPKPKDEK